MLEYIIDAAAIVNFVVGINLILGYRQLRRSWAALDRLQTQAEQNLQTAANEWREAKAFHEHVQVVDRFLSQVAAEAATNHMLYKLTVHEPWLEHMGDLRIQVSIHRRAWQFQSKDFTEETEEEE